MSDFEINEETLADSAVDILDEQLQQAVEQLEANKIRLLAQAFAAGYDGVDIKAQRQREWKTDVQDFKHGFEYEVWEGEPPELGIAPSGIQRYDFRSLDDWQQQELLSHIGLRVEDLDDD